MLKISTHKQHALLKKSTKVYGGDHFKKRKGRQTGRPISTQHTMHFVLRSKKATGAWSFLRHKAKIKQILEQFAKKNGVRLKTSANVGNHLHIHLQLTNRHTYRAFIRAVTGAIVMAVTGTSKWNKIAAAKNFWDGRPFSRIVVGFKAMLSLDDYIIINQMESQGYSRSETRFLLRWQSDPRFGPLRV